MVFLSLLVYDVQFQETIIMVKKHWLTHAERTRFVETSRYPETIAYCKKLQKASPWIRFTSFGKSPQGRDLPLLIASKNKRFEPAEARRSKMPVVLVINGIHPGEIAGKEASLALLRDIAVTKEKASLLDGVILLVVPIFSVDGHERFSPYNRINQNGPKEMGWRGTAQNLNLNRDWMKSDQPEMRAMLKLYTSWLPDFVIDNHVTDGADYQYDVTYIMDDHPRVAEPVRRYMKQYFEPYLETVLREKGHIPASYFELKNPNDLMDGIIAPPLSPRFSDGYGSLQNRPTVVVETHMLKSFEIRIKAHYNLMAAALEKFNLEPEVLRQAVRAADAQSITLGAKYNPDAAYPISVELTDDSEQLVFKGIEYTRELSPISGAMAVTYGEKPVDFTIPFLHTVVADRTVAPPLGYVVPPEWDVVLDRLELHGIEYGRLKKPITGKFETYRFAEVSFSQTPYESRQMARYRVNPVTEERTLPEGSAVVWLNQRTNRVILGLLEPDSPDSLVAWGLLNPIFEEKEYAEDYILVKVASRMVARDTNLRIEFEKRLENPDFAANPAARLRFFYDASPYRDHWKDAYPIVRITKRPIGS